MDNNKRGIKSFVSQAIPFGIFNRNIYDSNLPYTLLTSKHAYLTLANSHIGSRNYISLISFLFIYFFFLLLSSSLGLAFRENGMARVTKSHIEGKKKKNSFFISMFNIKQMGKLDKGF